MTQAIDRSGINQIQLGETLIGNGPYVLRQAPWTEMEFMRFQIGKMVGKEECYGDRVGREKPTGRTISTFKLLGWGKTFDAAHQVLKRQLLINETLK